MVVAVPAAAAAAATGTSLFQYNRENFMEDREQRMKMELALRRYRVAQAELWREDVRGFISLTERKMSIYLLVNVLMLGFTLNLWCEGRLPETTPEWLVMGHQISIASSFVFLLLTVWLAVHASVAAQSYQTRILTQLVRLPVPTWEELEACRTYGSDFERVHPEHIFRVPFLQGPQEKLVARGTPPKPKTAAAPLEACGDKESFYLEEGGTSPGACTPGGRSTASSLGGVSSHCARAAAEAVAADPWGLERSGEGSVYELGCHVGSEVAKLRHIKLIRQAAVYWQTYDAFARVSMSMGVAQIMLAMSYYMLGYVLTQVHAPMPAFAGVMVLMGTAEVVTRIDLTLPVLEQRLVQALMLTGPLISCIATYLWAQHENLPARIAESLAPFAFLSHGAVVILLTLVLRVREQENGAMLPLAYQGVLFLDVFGWVAHKHGTPEGIQELGVSLEDDSTPLSASPLADIEAPCSVASAAAATAAATPAWGARTERSRRRWSLRSWWARQRPVKKTPDREEASPNYFAVDYGQQIDAEEVLHHERPTARCITRDSTGRRALPTRPEDLREPSCADDCRHLAGAPRMWDKVNAVKPPAKEFWDAATFMPAESRLRDPVDNMLDEVPGFSLHQHKGGEEPALETGHDDEAPGVLPWRIVRMAAVITSLVWIAAGLYCIMQVANMWCRHLPWWWEIPVMEEHGGKGGHWHGTPPDEPWRPQRLAMMLEASSAGAAPKQLQVTWPYQTFQPLAFACNAAGSVLAATDGVAVLTADLRNSSASSAAPSPKRRPLLQLSPSRPASAGRAISAAAFRSAPDCAVMKGESVEDLAVLCSTAGQSSCHALLLHRRGRRLGICHLGGSGRGRSLLLARGWLRKSAGEKVISVFTDPDCMDTSSAATGELFATGCVWVGTTEGRAVQVQLGNDGMLIPADDMLGDRSGPKSMNAGALRLLHNRTLALLSSDTHELRFRGPQDPDYLPRKMLQAEAPGGFCAASTRVVSLGQGQAPKSLWSQQLS